MIDITHIKGYLIKSQPGTAGTKTLSPIKYFIIGPYKRLYTTSNLALLQFVMRSSENFEALFQKCEKTLKTICFDEIGDVTSVRTFEAPETLHFYNTKYFQISLKSNPSVVTIENAEPNGSFVASHEHSEPYQFNVFSFDDEFIDEMQRFFSHYHSFINDKDIVEKLLSLQVPLYRAEESAAPKESVVTQTQIDDFTKKMKLMTKKIELDRKNSENNIKPPPRSVIEEGETSDSKNSHRIVSLSNGSKYVGAIVNKRPHGQGKEFLSDGSSYVGEFKNGLWHGSGYLIDSENCLCYGEFLDDRVVGI